MKKYLILLFLFIPGIVYAGRGCCSQHGGVCGCTKYGKQLCCDNTPSPSCTCTPPTVYGCTDYRANNYNSEANTNDGSCTYTIRGCTDPSANNYNSSANENDGTCAYTIMGCTDSKANNYNSNANKDDGSCTYDVKGCMDKNATNYDEKATVDDGTCNYKTTTNNNISYDNNDYNSEESTDGDFIGGLGIMTLLSSIGAIIYAKKKKK